MNNEQKTMNKKTKYECGNSCSLFSVPCSLSKGFTIIEVMIAVGLFVIIMVMGVGAVLNTNTSHKQNQNQRLILDNLSFLIEDMSRNLRLGSQYQCPAGIAGTNSNDNYEYTFYVDPPYIDQTPATTECLPGGGEYPSIAFNPMEGDPTTHDDQFVYLIDQSEKAVFKSSDGGQNYIRVTGPEIEISDTKSGFSVIGSDTPGVQPRVIIRLSGVIHYKDIDTPFDIQTTVSQRLLEE